MGIWFTFAVLSGIFSGFNSFIKKIIAIKWLEKNQFLLYSTIIQIIMSFLYFIYTGSYFYMTFLFWFLIIIRIIWIIEMNSTMIESLKHIESSIFFPTYNLLSVLGGILVGIFLFWEYIYQWEILFLLIGTISILFLWYDKWKKNNKNFRKGIFFMVVSSLFLLLIFVINKYVWEKYDIGLYMFLCNIVWLLYLLLKIKLWKIKLNYNKEEIVYWNIHWILSFMWFLFLLLSFKDWKLVIVQLISIIAILIPIILWYLVLKEKINIYKLLWLLLFLGNLWFFYLNK